MKTEFREFAERQKIADVIFNSFCNGKVLEVSSPFLSVAKELAREFSSKTKKVAKIKIKI